MRSMLMGRASSFAHFAGLGRRARADDAPAKDDDKDGRKSRAADGDDDDGDDKDKGARADDPPPQFEDDKDKDGRKSRAADGDDDDDADDKDKGARAEAGDDDDDDDGKDKGARRARADDDDEEEEMSGKSAVAAARRRERARCHAIFAQPAAAQNPALACSLAFETNLTRKAAIAVLKGQAGVALSGKDRFAGRRERNPELGAGGGEPSGHQAVAASWDKAVAKAFPKTAARKG